MILYSYPGTCAFASHCAMEQAGATFELRHPDFQNLKQPEYVKINPKGRVPALVTEDGVLTETPAILMYIAATFPSAQLIPQTPWMIAKAQEFNSYLCATVHVAHAHKYRGYRWATEQSSFDDMKRKVPLSMRECFELIEGEYLTGPWVLGESMSICDLYLMTIARWLEGDGVDVIQLPKVVEHRNRVLDLPAVARALENEQVLSSSANKSL